MVAPVVLVRADAGPRIGSGHLVRQLALADLLAARGADVVVVTTGDDPRITAAGHRSVTVPEQDDGAGGRGAGAAPPPPPPAPVPAFNRGTPRSPWCGSSFPCSSPPGASRAG